MQQHKVIQYGLVWSHVFAIFLIVFMPIDFYFFKNQQSITQFIFEGLLQRIANNILHVNHFNSLISSDSISMYLLCIIFGIISILITVIGFKKIIAWQPILMSFIQYYIMYHLLKYGFDKLTKQQFYLPEPNILLSRVGDLHKDILYWSTIGSSRSYSIFLGSAEVIAAVLLFFAKTKKIGLIMCVGIFVNVVAINFCFDINVKILSSILLCFSLLCLANLYVQSENKIIFFEKTKFWILPILIIGIMFPTIKNKNWNDDAAPRPALHGAYQVQYACKAFTKIQHVVVHRDGFLIFMDDEQKSTSYPCFVDTVGKIILYKTDSENKQLNYAQNNKQIIFWQQSDTMVCKQIEWRKLNLLQNDFAWSLEAVK
jgi:hypothetical protein